MDKFELKLKTWGGLLNLGSGSILVILTIQGHYHNFHVLNCLSYLNTLQILKEKLGLIKFIECHSKWIYTIKRYFGMFSNLVSYFQFPIFLNN